MKSTHSKMSHESRNETMKNTPIHPIIAQIPDNVMTIKIKINYSLVRLLLRKECTHEEGKDNFYFYFGLH